MIEEGGVAKGKNKKKKVQKVEGEGEKAKAEEVIEKKKEKEEWVNENERLVGDFFCNSGDVDDDVKGFYVVELSGLFKVKVELISGWFIKMIDLWQIKLLCFINLSPSHKTSPSNPSTHQPNTKDRAVI